MERAGGGIPAGLSEGRCVPAGFVLDCSVFVRCSPEEWERNFRVGGGGGYRPVAVKAKGRKDGNQHRTSEVIDAMMGSHPKHL